MDSQNYRIYPVKVRVAVKGLTTPVIYYTWKLLSSLAAELLDLLHLH